LYFGFIKSDYYNFCLNVIFSIEAIAHVSISW